MYGSVMALEDELNKRFLRALQGTPWILSITTGEPPGEISDSDLISGLTAAVGAIHENVLQLAREIDASR
jgi:hypothetical protein